MPENNIRYRIEVYTDRNLKWFAEVGVFTDGNPGPRVCWTPTFETWVQAIEAAKQRIGAINDDN